VPRAKLELLKTEVNKLLEAGIIERSNSAYASPVLLVDKKDGSSRMVTDFRRLNVSTVFDPYPNARIDDIID
jgi:uncharacterized protein YqgQ